MSTISIPVTHTFVSAIAEQSNPALVGPNEWNAAHTATVPIMGASGASHTAGVVPDPGSSSGIVRFLREDASWDVPTTFGASGASHSVGYVPDPGASAGSTRFLREDATFATPSITTLPFVIPSTYNFAAQTPGGSLSVGANTITLNPMPAGINASSIGFGSIYISGGTGTAEAPLITGWSATTITFTCIYTHTGAWTIQSASAGIQEAIIASATVIELYIPSGTYNIYATINVPVSKQVSIHGAGITTTALYLWFAAGDGILYDSTTSGMVSIGNFRMLPQVTRTSGYDLHIKTATFGHVENILTQDTGNGFEFENCNSIQVHDLAVQTYTGNGFFLNASSSTTPVSGGFYSRLDAAGNGVNGILVQASVGAAHAGTLMSDLSIQGAANNIQFLPNGGAVNEFQLSNVLIDSWTIRGIYFAGGSGTGSGITLKGVRGSNNSSAGWMIGAYSNWSNIIMSSICSGGISGQGIVLYGAKNIQIANSHIAGDGSGSNSNTSLIIQDDSGTVANGIQVVDSTFGFSDSFGTTGDTATTGIYITALAHTNIRINNVSAYGSNGGGTGSLINYATGAGNVITNSNFVGHTVPAVASASTLTFPAEQDLFTITGTTGVGAVAGLIQGQKGSFITTTGAVTFTAGATIGNTLTTTQNVPVSWVFDGTKVWMQ